MSKVPFDTLTKFIICYNLTNAICIWYFDIFVWQEAKDLCVLRKKHIGSEWQIDHILPVSKGGTNEYTNIQVVPAKWNKQKSNKHSEKYDFT